MGEIIAMTGPQRSVRRDASPEGAEILFFTGVRYVRMADPDPALASVTPRRPARKPRRAAATTDVKIA